MSDYTLQHDWSQKEIDADPIDGDDYQVEFEAVQTAVNSKVENVPAPTSGNLVKTDGAGAVLDSGLKTAKTPQVDTAVIFEKDAVFDAVVDVAGTTNFTATWTDGNKQKGTLTGSGTATFVAPSGPCNLVLKITNSGAARTITWPGTVEWPDNIVPTPSGSGKIDLYMFFFDGSTYYGSAASNY
jgi:hypothetical protein